MSKCESLLDEWTRKHEPDLRSENKESSLVTESWKYKREMARKEHLEAFHDDKEGPDWTGLNQGHDGDFLRRTCASDKRLKSRAQGSWHAWIVQASQMVQDCDAAKNPRGTVGKQMSDRCGVRVGRFLAVWSKECQKCLV